MLPPRLVLRVFDCVFLFEDPFSPLCVSPCFYCVVLWLTLSGFFIVLLLTSPATFLTHFPSICHAVSLILACFWPVLGLCVIGCLALFQRLHPFFLARLALFCPLACFAPMC